MFIALTVAGGVLITVDVRFSALHVCGLIGLIMFASFGPFWAYTAEIEKRRKIKELYVKQQSQNVEEEYHSLDADIKHRSRKKYFKAIDESEKTEKCPKCGDLVESNENFCNKCGANLENKCPKCKMTNDLNDKFCRHCGKKLN